jgi:hypothetical protein
MKADDAEADRTCARVDCDKPATEAKDGDRPTFCAEHADMTVEEAADTFADNADTYDRNDTAAVAAHIDGGARPNDAPLTPVGEDTKPLTKVTPKRKKAAASEGGVSS